MRAFTADSVPTSNWAWCITSYSIHYTKLYDGTCDRLPTGKEAQKPSAVGQFESASSVITSYSIHYTKLYEYPLMLLPGTEAGTRNVVAEPPASEVNCTPLAASFTESSRSDTSEAV